MFLAKLLTSKSNSSSVGIFHTMVSKGDVFKISLVQQCKEFFGTNYLQQCLNSPDNAIHIVREAKSHLMEEDWNRTISIALTHSSLVHVTQPEIVNEWVKVWDAALDAGVKGTRIAQAVFRVMSRPVYGDKKCCYCNNTILEPSFIQHLSISHNFNYSRLFSSLISNKSTLFELPLSKDILKL